MAKIFRGRVVYGKGRAEIEVDQPFMLALEALIENTIPRTAHIMERTTRDLFKTAQRYWPVQVISAGTRGNVFALAGNRSGRAYTDKVRRSAAQEYNRRKDSAEASRSKLERGIRVTKTDLVAFVRNTAPYAYYIKPLWPYEEIVKPPKAVKNAAQDLILKPGTKAKLIDKMADQMAEELEKIERSA